MATTRQTLKQYFRQYATPTEAQFAALIDAFVHKDEDSLTQSKIDGLVAALEGKASTNQVNTMVASKVTEIVSDPQFAAAPTAHSHVAADVEGLSAFITRVTNFLDSADVSDTTINRWKEIESFLTGITDQETLTGLLLQLKNEITALIPAPAPTNYLKQISDLDAYTTAQEGEIVQYVGSTTAKYTRGYCYERVAGGTFHVPIGSVIMAVNDNEYGIKPGNYYETDEPATEPIPAYINEHSSINTPFQTFISQDGNIIMVSVGVYPDCVLIPDTNPQLGAEIVRTIGVTYEDFTITVFSWQPIVTSPSVS